MEYRYLNQENHFISCIRPNSYICQDSGEVLQNVRDPTVGDYLKSSSDWEDLL